MPLFQYFGWVGSLLLAALLAANWCVSAPIALRRILTFRSIRRSTSESIRIINGLNAWCLTPRFDVGAKTATPRRALAEARPRLAERQPFDAFAEMAAIAVRPCFRPPCSAARLRNEKLADR